MKKSKDERRALADLRGDAGPLPWFEPGAAVDGTAVHIRKQRSHATAPDRRRRRISSSGIVARSSVAARSSSSSSAGAICDRLQLSAHGLGVLEALVEAPARDVLVHWAHRAESPLRPCVGIPKGRREGAGAVRVDRGADRDVDDAHPGVGGRRRSRGRLLQRGLSNGRDRLCEVDVQVAGRRRRRSRSRSGDDGGSCDVSAVDSRVLLPLARGRSLRIGRGGGTRENGSSLHQ